MERLQKVMAHAGVASRRQAEAWILAGRVRVNGQIIKELGLKVDPSMDQIEVDGRLIEQEQKRTFLFYKPMHVVTTMQDPQGRETVADFFKRIEERVYPIGRLDYDTEGLLLMTNDGELANHLTHPRYEVEKTYIATVRGEPQEEQLNQLRQGIQLDDGMTAPAHISTLSPKRVGESRIQLIIHEGRNRQVRRMCEAIGFPVKHLIRTHIGFLNMKGLTRGTFRELNKQDLTRLQNEK
ncbi:rRNA pseudouridine synthase [Hazenella sp. IB182357]|uniref:Pseudouridine synthase n=1 Tax=Polycladospora coralii TaxID=2771432 RepID=A0A926N663_9BACL|nr:pseudouridine synthase [Polycladospora coralii]MBD1371666.1 rRNA pseudouridine synthase [Polycladospora coralii]MBS7529133.1 rRNA pseudouridine synthase [Polycladospora coralii]